MAVDALDTRILRLLMEQPRTSVREYARILGIARGTVQARIDRMEREGVITGTGPYLSPAALGHPVLAFVHIEVTQGHLDDVGDALAAVPEIIEAFSITGGGDLITRVAARDNGHLEDVIQRLIQLPGVVRTRTEMALRERVPHRLLPLVESVGRAAGRGTVSHALASWSAWASCASLRSSSISTEHSWTASRTTTRRGAGSWPSTA